MPLPKDAVVVVVFEDDDHDDDVENVDDKFYSITPAINKDVLACSKCYLC